MIKCIFMVCTVGRNSTFFDTFFDLKKNVLMSYLYFFQTLKPTRKKRRQKSKNVLSKSVLDLNFVPIKGSVFLIFFKKIKFVVP